MLILSRPAVLAPMPYLQGGPVMYKTEDLAIRIAERARDYAARAEERIDGEGEDVWASFGNGIVGLVLAEIATLLQAQLEEES